MANTIIDNSSAIAAADSIVDLLDGGGAAGTLQIYDSTQPTDLDATLGNQTLLAELTLSDPAFGNAADNNPGGKATANSISDDTSANASGTATWFTGLDSNGNRIVAGDASATGGGGDLQLDSTSISAGATVSVTSWTITMPES